MARDYLAIVKQVEGYQPKALGTATLNAVLQTQDEPLRQNLLDYANFALSELEKVNRWRKGFTATTVVTAAGTSLYSFASNGWINIHKIYWRYSTGRVVEMELMDQQEPRMIFGDGPNAQQGPPRFYALVGAQGSQLQLYPTPDASGPDSGNYTLQIEYYQSLPKLIETVGTTTALSTTLVVPSTAYLTAAGALAANPNLDTLSVRGAGNPTGKSGPNANDDLVTPWTAFPSAINVTMSSPAVTAIAGATAQVFLYSTNWLIDNGPKVLLYAMMREVASYEESTDDYAKWEARYEKALEDLMEWDQQSRHDVEVLAGAVAGQRQPLLRDIDWPSMFETRGVVN